MRKVEFDFAVFFSGVRMSVFAGVFKKSCVFTWFLGGETEVNVWQIKVICHVIFSAEKNATFSTLFFAT
jgi:hypothetical protein